MLYYVDTGNQHDPAINLALEEYLLRQPQFNDDVLLLYINDPCIIIGCHQNAIEEINLKYIDQHHIHVIRRLSGGGAVYHDLGNLNFSFITHFQPNYFTNFKLFTEPVIRCLKSLGVPAQLNARSDILIDGEKISGNAQYISQGRLVSHGTLLFNSDLSQMREALHVQENQIVSKGIKSIRSRVVNISPFLNPSISLEEFKSALLASYFENSPDNYSHSLNSEDWQQIHTLADARYRQWEWNYGHSPAFTLEKHFRHAEGEIGARLYVEKGIIQSILFFSDELNLIDPSRLEQLLTGIRYEPGSITLALQDFSLDDFLPGLDRLAFLDFIYYS